MDLSKVFSTHSSTRPKSIVGIFLVKLQFSVWALGSVQYKSLNCNLVYLYKKYKIEE